MYGHLGMYDGVPMKPLKRDNVGRVPSVFTFTDMVRLCFPSLCMLLFDAKSSCALSTCAFLSSRFRLCFVFGGA